TSRTGGCGPRTCPRRRRRRCTWCSAPDLGEVVGDRCRVVEGGDGADVAVRADHDAPTVLESESLSHKAFRVGDDGVVPGDRDVVCRHQHSDLTFPCGRGWLPGRDGEDDVTGVLHAAHRGELLLYRRVDHMRKMFAGSHFGGLRAPTHGDRAVAVVDVDLFG